MNVNNIHTRRVQLSRDHSQCSRKLWINPLVMHHLKRFYLRSLSISQASSVDIVEYYDLGKNCIDILLFIKNLVKVFIHLIIHTSFINLRSVGRILIGRQLSISGLFFFLCVGRISAAYKFEEKLELNKELLILWYIK